MIIETFWSVDLRQSKLNSDMLFVGMSWE